MLPPLFTLLSPEATADALEAIAAAAATVRADMALERAVALEAAGYDPLFASDVADAEVFGF